MKITTLAEAAQNAAEKVANGTHVVVPVGLLEVLAKAGAASNILARHDALLAAGREPDHGWAISPPVNR